MSAFQKAGVAYLAGSQRSLKIIVNGAAYFISMRDLHRALRNPSSHADVYSIVHKEHIEQDAGEASKQKILRFSVFFDPKDSRGE